MCTSSDAIHPQTVWDIGEKFRFGLFSIVISIGGRREKKKNEKEKEEKDRVLAKLEAGTDVRRGTFVQL